MWFSILLIDVDGGVVNHFGDDALPERRVRVLVGWVVNVVDGVLDVLGGELLAVVEDDTPAEVEAPLVPVADLPPLGKGRNELELPGEIGQAVEHLGGAVDDRLTDRVWKEVLRYAAVGERDDVLGLTPSRTRAGRRQAGGGREGGGGSDEVATAKAGSDGLQDALVSHRSASS